MTVQPGWADPITFNVTLFSIPGSTSTTAIGINNAGQIVGFYSGGAFLYQNGTFSNLNIPAATISGPFGIPQQVAINDSGQIVGTTNNGRGFLYANGQLTFLPLEYIHFPPLLP